MSQRSWDEFVAHLEEVYLPSLTPEQRALQCPDSAVPADLWQAAKIIFPSPEAWLGNPIPQLQGKSALEAIKAGGDAQVRDIMMGVAEFFLPPAEEVVPYEEWAQGTCAVDAPNEATGSDEGHELGG